jgi:AcrR family transcriptional regulator
MRDDALARFWLRTVFVSKVSENPTTVSSCQIAIDNYSPISAAGGSASILRMIEAASRYCGARRYVRSRSLDVVHRDEIILKAAEDLFYQRSFAGVGVAEIGKRAGISGPGIYKHFSSKDEILATLLERAALQLLIQIGEPREDPWEELESLVRGHIEFVLERPKLAAIWVREVRVLGGAEQRRMERRDAAYTERFEGVLQRCFPDRPQGQLVAATWMLIFQTSAVGLWPVQARREPGLADLMTNVALAGLAALRGDDRSGFADAV